MTSPGGNVVEIHVRTKDETNFDAVAGKARKLAQTIDGGTGSAGAALESAGAKAKGFGAVMGQVGTVASGILLAGAVQAGARRALALMHSTVTAAKDLGESVNAVSKIFDQSSDVINDWGKNNANAFGLSQRAFNQAATPLGAMLKNTGMSMDEVAKETIKLTERGADLASVFNTEVPDALGAIGAALRGETEPIRRYGVNLNEIMIQQKALAMSGKDSAAMLTTQEKAYARLALIYEQTADSAGDFKDTSGDLANATRIQTATVEEAKAKIGTAYLPVLAKAAQLTGGLAESFTSLPGPAQLATAVIVAIGAAAVIAAPRIIAFKTALDVMAASSSRATRSLGLLLSTLTRVGTVIAVVAVAREVAKQFGVLNDVLGAVPGIGDDLVEAYGEVSRSLKVATHGATASKQAQQVLNSTMEEQIGLGESMVTVWDKIHGAQANVHKQTLATKEAITELHDQFKEGKFSIDEHTTAGLRNVTALEDVARQAAEAAEAYLEQTGDAEGAKKMMDQFRAAAEKSIGATGKAKAAVHGLAVELFKLPEFKELLIKANIQVTGAGQLHRALTDVQRLGGFAHGGISGAASGGARGGLVWTGEQGPELVRLPYGSTVYPSGQSKAMAAQGGGGGDVRVVIEDRTSGGIRARAISEGLARGVPAATLQAAYP